MAKVIVVGGGFAGIAAATSLAQQGIGVDLFESRSSLGGRVYSTDPVEAFPAPVDNGPHLFMGCYRETWALLKRLGTENSFHWIDPLSLTWLLAGGKKVSLTCPPLPAPFHLAFGLLTCDAFPFKEKILIIKALARFTKKPFALDSSLKNVSQFLDSTRQGPLSRERFWIPLCNAVMNVSVEEAPLLGFGEVLHQVFFGTRRDSSLALAAKPLSELGFSQVRDFLSQRGGSLRLQEGIQTFKVEGDSWELSNRGGMNFSADALIWAVPPPSLYALWPKGTWKEIENLPQLGKSPIVSVHLILSERVLEGAMVGFPGARFEWVFNRNDNWNYNGAGQYLSFTASSAETLARLSQEELVSLAFKELQERCPKALGVEIKYSKITKEMAATFRWTEQTDLLRLPSETPLSNVFLAGDWTATGLPATIEGACFSGHRAAQRVMQYIHGNPSHC